MRVISAGECMVEFFRREDGLWRQGYAGDTLNVAWAMRALMPDEDEVAYLTRVGTDAFSDAMLAFLEDEGIGTALVTRDPTRRPGLYTIETDEDGERTFTYWRSDSAARGLAADGPALATALSGADLVYISGITLAILPEADRAHLFEALGSRGGRGFKVAFDPNVRPALWPDPAIMREALTEAARRSDIVLPTHDDEAKAFGDKGPEATMERYAGLGVAEIVVKNGTEPTLFRLDGADGAAPVKPNPSVLDTTGAGDSFSGTYLARRLLGAPQAEAVAAAQRVSAMVVGHRGALAPFRDIVKAAK